MLLNAKMQTILLNLIITIAPRVLFKSVDRQYSMKIGKIYENNVTFVTHDSGVIVKLFWCAVIGEKICTQNSLNKP